MGEGVNEPAASGRKCDPPPEDPGSERWLGGWGEAGRDECGVKDRVGGRDVDRGDEVLQRRRRREGGRSVSQHYSRRANLL